MSALHNLSPLATLVTPHTDEHGKQWQLVIAKGVWRLDTNTLADTTGLLAPQRAPIVRSTRDLVLTPMQRQVLGARLDLRLEWFPSDATPPKPAFDFLVCGYAHAPQATPCKRFTATVTWDERDVGGKAQEQKHILEVHAPRYWVATLLQGGGAVPGEHLAPVTQVPLHPAFAYGGESDVDAVFNPLGMGHISGAQSVNRLAMPWLELGGTWSTLSTRMSRPKPAALGPWPAHAGHRQPYIGTYDAAWKKNRWPLPPKDFHPRFHNQADPALQWPRAPNAGSLIHLENLTTTGADCIRWPALQAVLDCNRTTTLMQADTCIVDTEARHYAIVWRALLPPHATATLRIHPV